MKVRAIGLRAKCLTGTARIGVDSNFVGFESVHRNGHIKLNSELWKGSMDL